MSNDILTDVPFRLSEYDDYSKNGDFKHWVKEKQRGIIKSTIRI